MPQRDKLALVVTGSVAAVKTFLLVDALLAQGFNVQCMVTEAAWHFLRQDGKYKATPEQLAALEQDAPPPENLFAWADTILVAPASADFIRQVALGDTETGRLIKNSKKPVFLAPAMNFMMWQHPAVQKNLRRAMEAGTKVIGPAWGDMACGDQGYGRLVEPVDIAAAMVNEKHPLFSVRQALFDQPMLPQLARKPRHKMLLAVTEWRDDIPARIQDWQAEGYDIQCVISHGNENPAMPDLFRHPKARLRVM